VLFATGNPDLGPIVSSYVGTLLLTGCYLAIGILCSALTENQIVAGALTFALGLFFWLVSWATQSAGPVWSDMSTSDIFYYLSFIGIGLFLTHRILDSYRWR
jgi:ABC-2 type transport system permease protein